MLFALDTALIEEVDPNNISSKLVIDGSDAEHPALWEGEETALGYTNHLAVSGKDVFLAQGDGGVQRMSLP